MEQASDSEDMNEGAPFADETEGKKTTIAVGDVDTCLCTFQFDPVVCEDGQQYSNLCAAECEGLTQCTRPAAPIPDLVFEETDPAIIEPEVL